MRIILYSLFLSFGALLAGAQLLRSQTLPESRVTSSGTARNKDGYSVLSMESMLPPRLGTPLLDRRGGDVVKQTPYEVIDRLVVEPRQLP